MQSCESLGNEVFEPHGDRLSRWDAGWALVLTGMIVLAWCLAFGRLDVTAWKTPLKYDGDALGIMAFARAYEKGEISLFTQKSVESLNAPSGAHWDDYPITNDALFFFLGLIARLLGIMAAANVGVVLAHVLAGSSFFMVCRILGYAKPFSFMGAVVFSFSPYLVTRSLDHLNLTYGWHIPIFLLVVWWGLSDSGFSRGSRRYWFSIVTGIVTGIQNPYYTNIFLQFLGFAVLSKLLRKDWRQAVSLLSVGLATVASFFLMNADTLSYQWEHGLNPAAIVRSYGGLEIYALKPIELFLPGNHRWDWWAKFSYDHYFSQVAARGESVSGFYSYSGLVGGAALIWLAGLTVYRLLGPGPGKPPPHAWQVLWILLYAAVGGIASVLGVLGIFLFRCSNRLSIVIVALALLFLVRQMTRWCPRRLSVPVAVVIVAIALWDQLPSGEHLTSVEEIRSKVSSDRMFVQELEKALPDGAMVFQLPVKEFPETPPIHLLKDYEPFRPYLFARHLTFSYGTVKGRPADHWQTILGKGSAGLVARELERRGFRGILIHRSGYVDRAEGVLRELAASGRDQWVESSLKDLAFVFLNPDQVGPSRVTDDVFPVFLEGWYPQEVAAGGQWWVWSNGIGSAVVVLYSTNPEAVQRCFKFGIGTLAARRVEITFQESTLLGIELGDRETKVIQRLCMELLPGENRLDVLTDAPGVVPNSPDPRTLAVRIDTMERVDESDSGRRR